MAQCPEELPRPHQPRPQPQPLPQAPRQSPRPQSSPKKSRSLKKSRSPASPVGLLGNRGLSRLLTPSAPNAAKTTVEGLVAQASDLRTYSFSIVANDANGQRIKTGGDKFDAAIDGPSVATARVEDNNDGTYKVFYSLTQAGDYKINVRIGGAHISGSPFAVRCFEG